MLQGAIGAGIMILLIKFTPFLVSKAYRISELEAEKRRPGYFAILTIGNIIATIILLFAIAFVDIKLFAFSAIWIALVVTWFVLARTGKIEWKPAPVSSVGKLFFCPKCHATYKKEGESDICPDCSTRTIPTTVGVNTWEKLSTEEKALLIDAFNDGMFILSDDNYVDYKEGDIYSVNVKYNGNGEKLILCTGENGNQAWVLESKANEWLEHQKTEVSSDVEKIVSVQENDAQNAAAEDVVVTSNEKPENEAKKETYIYAESANGMIVRIPESKYESWEKNQQKIRENGIDTTVFDEVREKLRGVNLNAMVASVAKETEESKESSDKIESPAISVDVPVAATIDNNSKLKMTEEKSNNVRHVVPREKEVRFCYHCGYRVLNDSFFCEKCGTKIR